ncbi:MAG: caspase family protein [Myxococcaceae bacterium]
MVCVLVVLSASTAAAESRRLAIVVGNNAGEGAYQPLRYAESDAGKMARVLVELGDVLGDDVLLLQGRRVSDLERAIGDARERVAQFKKSPDTRAVLIFYFSGHSDGESIEMGTEKLPYARLKAMLAGTGADLRVAIVDACKSGGGFQEKGGKPAEAFAIKLTDTLVASGEAFITSSAADESALESSEVMGSYFTHNFISGLRGAADSSGDRLVTLAEAYRYAYDRTVQATAMAPVGVQHPNYDFRLSGQGELVLSSLVKPSASFLLPDGADRTMVTDLVRDQVVVEVPSGPAREVALAPGEYGVRAFKDGKSFGGRFRLNEGVHLQVRWEQLTQVSSGVVVAAKGGDITTRLDDDFGPDTNKWALSVGLGAVEPLVYTLGDSSLHPQMRIGFEPRLGPGFTASILGYTSTATATPKVGLSDGTRPEAGVQARAGFRWSWTLWRFWFGAGAEVGGGLTWQTDNLGAVNLAGVGAIAPRGTVRFQVYGPLMVSLDVEAAVMFATVDTVFQAIFRPSGQLGVTLTF